jgi:hypothetical protein
MIDRVLLLFTNVRHEDADALAELLARQEDVKFTLVTARAEGAPTPLRLPHSTLILIALEDVPEPSTSLPSWLPPVGTALWLRRRGGQGQVLDPARLAGVLVVMVENKESASESELADWYDNVHIPEAIAAGSYHAGSRWEVMATRLPAGAENEVPPLLSLWETSWSDGTAALAQLTENAANMTWLPSAHPIHVGSYNLEAIHRSERES